MANGPPAVGMGLVPGGQGLGDLGQPVVQLLGRAGVERRHGADDAGLALLDHQLGVADDEQRRADDGQRQFCSAAGSLDMDVSLKVQYDKGWSACHTSAPALF
jgi:hypothetical protein